MLPDRERRKASGYCQIHQWQHGQDTCPGCMFQSPERNYLAEAQALLRNESALLPEHGHLEALNIHFQSEIIRINHEVQQLMQDWLMRH